MTSKILCGMSISVAVTMMVLCSGCAIDADLEATPAFVDVGEPVTLDVALTNLSQCPVLDGPTGPLPGGAFGIIFPLVPRYALVDQIPDQEIRDGMRQLVDAFCTGGELEIAGLPGARCEFVEGSIRCTVDEIRTPPLGGGGAGGGASAPAYQISTEHGIACDVEGSTATCQIPQSVLTEVGTAQSSTVPGTSEASFGLDCQQIDGIAGCLASTLNGGEKKTGQIVVTPEELGIFRSWMFAFGRVGGVCIGESDPCEDDGDCDRGECGSGICADGSRAGLGCDETGDCLGGACVDCGSDPNQLVLSGIACAQTNVMSPLGAPALSIWGMAAAVLAMLGVVFIFGFGRKRAQGTPY